MAIFEVLNNQQSYFNRYFRRNKGSTDYATIPEVTFSGDFSISFSSSSLAGSYLGSRASSSFRIVTFGTNLIIGVNGIDTATFDASAIELSRLQEFVVTRSGSTFTCSAGGVGLVQTGGAGSAAPVSIDSIYSPWGQVTSVPYLSGILANLKIYDNGELIHYWKINSNANTEADLVSGATMTIINGNADDWGLFDRQANGEWLGQELVVNGEFDSDLSGWEVTEAGQTVEWDNGRLHIITDGTGCGVRQVLLSDNITYQVALNYEAVSGGLKYQVGASSYALNSTQSVLSDHLADGANFFLYRGIGAGEGYFDNVSVKEVLKNA